MHTAVMTGQIDLVELLVREGASVNVTDEVHSEGWKTLARVYCALDVLTDEYGCRKATRRCSWPL